MGYYSLVLIQRSPGRLDAAVQTSEQALYTLITGGRPGLTRSGRLAQPGPARRARLLLAQGDVAAAASPAQDNGLRPDDEQDYARARELSRIP